MFPVVVKFPVVVTLEVALGKLHCLMCNVSLSLQCVLPMHQLDTMHYIFGQS